ncbi:hypothetical protein D0Z00_000363 [Geotrichum galactomycetum]|uniref:Uncharacterized protein n=1 Tax=Geotrichum galactomycetum TaxID=27317 RepID=A0ACB6V9Z0_9ASCO|nr:hypothetical protein D0Z00_000363 [Geotrichum candidum]
MGLIAILTLLFKRSREQPQRPLWVWVFDVSKQVFGALGLHFINLLLSTNNASPSSAVASPLMTLASVVVSGNSTTKPEPEPGSSACTWYFLNLFLDTTVGIPILWFFLYMIHMTAFRVGMTGIISGQYHDEPEDLSVPLTPEEQIPRWRNFFKQAGLYLLGMICMKSVLYSLTELFPWLDDIAGAFLTFLKKLFFIDKVHRTQFETVFVILIFPSIMNTLQYYLIDTIIQSPEYHSYDEPVRKGAGAEESESLAGASARRGATGAPNYGSIDRGVADTGITTATRPPLVRHHDGYDFLGQREAEAESVAWHKRLLNSIVPSESLR